MDTIRFKLITLIGTFIVVFSFIMIGYLHKRNVLVMEPLGHQLINDDLSGTWWVTITDENHSFIKKYNLTLPLTDFKNNYLVVSGGRPIKRIVYNRISKYRWRYKEAYKGEAVFSKEYNSKKIYYYKSERVLCHQDDLGPPKITIE